MTTGSAVPTRKNIVLCSDGTGNTTVKGRGTNVFKLFEAIDVNGHRSDPMLKRQLAFYDDGVGTESLKWLRVFAGATGYGLSRNVKKLYRELCRVYEPGDSVYLFGFSRGAFTVRTLSGLIEDCGILDVREYATEESFSRQTRAAYQAYRRKYRAWLARAFSRGGMEAAEFKRRFARADQPEQPIRLLGVWDTVDAVGLPFGLADAWNRLIWQYKFETSTLSEAVQRGCHALALDDNREAFSPVLWDERKPRNAARVEQVWFAGAHSNVGGGYPQQGMSLVTLDWMMKHAEADGLRFVSHARAQYAAEHSFADRLYEPRSGLGVFYRWKPRDVQALSARRGIPVPSVHASVIERVAQAPRGYAPGNVPPRIRIVATEDNPQIRMTDVADTIVAAHGGEGALPLAQRHPNWLRVGFIAYVTFIGGTAGAVGRAIYVALAESTAAQESLLPSVTTLATSFPLALAAAFWKDWPAFWLLVAGLGVGYMLSAWSDNRMSRFSSSFWHLHRSTLRAALRRTPPPDLVATALPAAIELPQMIERPQPVERTPAVERPETA